MKGIKQTIIQHIDSLISEKIEALKLNIASARESRNNDTKSSAGDKFETGREVINSEIQKGEVQLAKQFKLQNDLKQLKLSKTYKKVEFGSLVFTNQFNYFIAIPFGKISINGKEFYAISLASPLGKQLFEKQVGDTIVFNDNKIKIEKLA